MKTTLTFTHEEELEAEVALVSWDTAINLLTFNQILRKAHNNLEFMDDNEKTEALEEQITNLRRDFNELFGEIIDKIP